MRTTNNVPLHTLEPPFPQHGIRREKEVRTRRLGKYYVVREIHPSTDLEMSLIGKVMDGTLARARRKALVQ